MDTRTADKLKKEVRAWVDFIAPAIDDHNDLVVLGLGQGLHINFLLQSYLNLTITVVEPREELIHGFSTIALGSIRYVRSLDGVKRLHDALSVSEKPIPVLPYRPSWYPNKIFFEWAYSYLLDKNCFANWRNSPSEFILESLFV